MERGVSVQVMYVKARELDAAREIIDQAYDLASERTADAAEWPHVFNQACNLLAQGTFLTPQPQHVDLGALARMNGPHR
jgi:hypothetical protein